MHLIYFFFSVLNVPPHAKSWLIGKDSGAGRDWGQEEKGTTEDEMAGWHHWLDGRESQWTPEVGDGQGGLACCDSWSRKESDTTERLIWSDLITIKWIELIILKLKKKIKDSSVAQSCPTLCDPMNWITPGLPVHHQLPESTQTHVHWVGDAIHPSHPLSSPSPPNLNLSQHQGLFKWVSSSHQVVKVLEFHK